MESLAIHLNILSTDVFLGEPGLLPSSSDEKETILQVIRSFMGESITVISKQLDSVNKRQPMKKCCYKPRNIGLLMFAVSGVTSPVYSPANDHEDIFFEFDCMPAATKKTCSIAMCWNFSFIPKDPMRFGTLDGSVMMRSAGGSIAACWWCLVSDDVKSFSDHYNGRRPILRRVHYQWDSSVSWLFLEKFKVLVISLIIQDWSEQRLSG